MRITLRDGPSVDLVQIWPRVRQRHVPRSGDFVSLVAEPDSIDYLAMLSEASFDAAAGRAKRVFQSNSPMPESARARLDMGSIPGLTESNDSACYPILIRRVGGLRTLVGYEVGRSRDVLQFDDLPVGEPLVIEVLDSAFGRILYQQSCVVPADRGAVVDLLESVRAVRVLAVAGDEPWEGVEVGITPRSKAQYPSWRDVHRTDAHGEALLHLRDVHAYDVLVQADANEGSTVAAELDQRLGVAEPSHTFDFAQGFRLRVHDGQGWLAPSDNCKVHVEGEVDAGRRVHFRHEVDAGEDGVFTVRTGLAGIVRGRVVILDKTALPADSAWSEVPQCIPFQAIAQGVRSPLRVVELQLPVGSVTGGKGATRELSLSCLTPEGERLRLRAESTTVEARAVGMSGLPSSLTFDNPPRWRELAWRRRADGAATIDVPSWIAECELRVLVGDYAPASVRVDAAYISASADVDLRLRAGSGAVLGDATDRGKPIGVGLAAGDVVERIGERAISCQREMTAALAAADPSLPLTVTVRRGTATMDITLPVGWRELLTRTHYATW